jgi:phosphatidylinositol glycan class S
MKISNDIYNKILTFFILYILPCQSNFIFLHSLSKMKLFEVIRKELPDEKLYLFINRFIFSFIFLFIGLPLWYSTTTTYRASLPYSRISTLASKPSDSIETNLTSFQTASSYEVSFYLINNNDEHYSLNKSQYEEIISSTLVPYLINTYSNYIDFDISTEVISNTRGILPSETIHNLEKKQIPFFLNKLEYLLHRSTKHYREKIYFILFIPDEKQSPLTIDDNQDNSVIVPEWGSVIFYNKFNSKDDLSLIMKQFLNHFHQLLGIQTLDQWIYLRTIENFNNGRQTLSTLSQLLLSIPNIVIDDIMAKKIHNSLDLLEICQDKQEHKHCRQGRLLADQVFFDPSLLKLLYFPDDQKFAIYVPLYLPMGAPLAWTLYNDIKFLIKIVRNKH